MDIEREDFEAMAQTEWPHYGLLTDETGSYQEVFLQGAWEGWQAARESEVWELESELRSHKQAIAGMQSELDAAKAEIERLNPAVLQFARHMQIKLDANKHKDGKGWDRNPDGSRNGWAGCTRGFLEGKLAEEVGELLEALKGIDKDQIRLEAADVGNIAMMLADRFGNLTRPDPPEQEPS